MTNITDADIIAALDDCNSIQISRIISEVGVNYRLSQEDNDPIINFAISDSESKAYKDILRFEPDLSLQNDLGETILHSAVYSGVIDRVEVVFKPELVDVQSEDGTTPLLLSIGLENEEFALYFIEAGADVNLADKDGNRPIHLAAYFGLSKVVSALLEQNAKVKVKTDKGNYPLSLAINNDFYDIALQLMNNHEGLIHI